MFGVFALFGGALIGCYLFGTFVLGIYFWSEDWCVPHWVWVSWDKRKYINSLSREDRLAFLHHERRKKDYAEIMQRALVEVNRRRQAEYDRTGVDPKSAPGRTWEVANAVTAEWHLDTDWEDVRRVPDCPITTLINDSFIVEKKVRKPSWEPPKWR